MPNIEGASKKTTDLVTEWRKAKLALNQAEMVVGERERALSKAQNALGGHLVPSDVRQDETFCIWVRDPETDSDRLLNVKYVGAGVYEFSWRKGE